MPIRHRLVTLLTLHTLAACAGRDYTRGPASADLLVSVRGGTVTAPDSIPPGWARVRVEEDRNGHILVIFRLPEALTDADLAAFLTELDTAPATPAPALAMSGPEVGATGDVVVQFTPGRYLLGCVRRNEDGHRHASSGESKVLLVPDTPVSSTREAAPTSTAVVEMVDFAYGGPERWPAGVNMLRIDNRGQQDHQLRLLRLNTGSSLEDWMTAEDPGDHGETLAGVARLGPGGVVYLPVELSAGAYVAYCLVTDPASGLPHIELGMVRGIQVE